MKPSESTSRLLRKACSAIEVGNLPQARSLLAQCPAVPLKSRRSSWSKRSLTRILLRDGFTDRYAGGPLVFPGALRALSTLMPAEFPYHPNWQQSQTHPAYWLLYPTLDHRVPLARGGLDIEDNVVTTSMLRNSQKANWLLEELGWATSLEPCLPGWDGLLPWFMRMFEREPMLRQITALRQWYAAARQAGG